MDFFSNTGYAQVGRYVYEFANDMNENGEYFPIWGTCLGFELMLRLAGGDADLLTPCEAEGVAQRLHLQGNNSRLLSQANNEIQQILETEKVAANFHKFCVTKENFTSFGLNKEWQVLATNKDLNGLEFISAVEHRTYPYYAVQFHPEKNIYEWYPSKAIIHTKDAVKASQYFAEFFVEECRKNLNAFKTPTEENRYLIYNWPPVFIGRNESSTLIQVYHFGDGDGHSHISKMISSSSSYSF